ncbi:MAG: M23 family metallopeptidase [Acidobacteriota bacterium]|nr:M23 family metallopeptidase [Acidobacteriota bacterium]
MKKRFYIVLVSREQDGSLRKVPVPLHYAYGFVAAAVIGAFTIAGLAGSYSRMLIKTARFNQLRTDHNSLQKDYAHLEEQAHQKDVQVASLGSLATEVSAIYGLTAGRLVPHGHPATAERAASAGTKAAAGALVGDSGGTFTEENYYKSVDTFYRLRDSAMSGAAAQAIGSVATFGSATAARLNSFTGLGGVETVLNAPSLWPILGPIRSSFGQREDPISGNGEGEFHTGIDISSPIGTPIRAAGGGVVKSAAMVNGYGREVVLDHGGNVETCYAHLSGFTVIAGQQVVRGQVIGYVGVSGRTTGAHLHYEVRIRNTPVNPHKYLRDTPAGIGMDTAALRGGPAHAGL